MSKRTKQRTIRQERLPHREAVQRLLRVYAKLSVAGAALSSGQTAKAKQEREA